MVWARGSKLALKIAVWAVNLKAHTFFYGQSRKISLKKKSQFFKQYFEKRVSSVSINFCP